MRIFRLGSGSLVVAVVLSLASAGDVRAEDPKPPEKSATKPANKDEKAKPAAPEREKAKPPAAENDKPKDKAEKTASSAPATTAPAVAAPATPKPVPTAAAPTNEPPVTAPAVTPPVPALQPPPPSVPVKAAKVKRPKTPWSTYSASDGKYAWAEPSGWTLDESHSVGGQSMTWTEPGGTGTFRVVAYPKTGASLTDLVKAASFGGKPHASKAWLCAQGEQGDLRIAVAATTLSSGDSLLLVLSAPSTSFRWLGGLSGVLRAANAAVGFHAKGADWQPEQ
jgi:hypothetical protein